MSKVVRKVTQDERPTKRAKMSVSNNVKRSYRRVPRSIKQNRWSFERMTNPIPLTYNNANGFYNAAATLNYGICLKLSFALSQVYMYGGVQNTTASVPGYTDFQNLFDLFRIDWVEMIITHACTSNTINVNNSGTGVTCHPTYYIAYDNTDNQVTSTLNEIQQKSGVILWRPNASGEVFKKRFYPTIMSTVGNAGSTTNQQLEVPRGAFISTAATTAQFAGIDIGTDSFSQLGSTNTPIQFNFKYGLTCKRLK